MDSWDNTIPRDQPTGKEGPAEEGSVEEWEADGVMRGEEREGNGGTGNDSAAADAAAAEAEEGDSGGCGDTRSGEADCSSIGMGGGASRSNDEPDG